jgi:hypothetical protein
MSLRPLFHPFAWFDSPKVLDCTVTPIPGSGSSPLEVIASLPVQVHAIHTTDSTGAYIGVYSGAAGQEVLRAIVGGGQELIEAGIAKGERVSLRSMDTANITAGSICCQFMGKAS